MAFVALSWMPPWFDRLAARICLGAAFNAEVQGILGVLDSAADAKCRMQIAQHQFRCSPKTPCALIKWVQTTLVQEMCVFTSGLFSLGASIFLHQNPDLFNGEVSRAIIFPITLPLATPKLSEEESIEKTRWWEGCWNCYWYTQESYFFPRGKLFNFTESHP